MRAPLARSPLVRIAIAAFAAAVLTGCSAADSKAAQGAERPASARNSAEPTVSASQMKENACAQYSVRKAVLATLNGFGSDEIAKIRVGTELARQAADADPAYGAFADDYAEFERAMQQLLDLAPKAEADPLGTMDEIRKVSLKAADYVPGCP